MESCMRQQRRRAGLTQSQVAGALGMRSASAVSMWERGQRTPRLERLVALAGLLGCTVGQLLGEQSEKGGAGGGAVGE